MNGKNLVENKMADAHWFVECMERGCKIVVIAPEYGAPSTKADYWIPVRPSTDAALWLGVTRLMMDNKLVRRDVREAVHGLPAAGAHRQRQAPARGRGFPNYASTLPRTARARRSRASPTSSTKKLGDFVVWDAKANSPKALTRDMVGETLAKSGIEPTLDWKGTVKLVDGSESSADARGICTRCTCKDYDLDTSPRSRTLPKELIERLAKDIATIKPTSIHQGEGINHWFHATEANRAAYLPLMLTGNIGKPGAGCHGWAGNYKAALFQGSKLTGPGFKGWVMPKIRSSPTSIPRRTAGCHAHAYTKDEEPAYWNHGDRPLIVDTPKDGPQSLHRQDAHAHADQGDLHFTNVNLINNAKWAYEMIKNVNPNVELIVTMDTQMTASVEYSDFGLPANSWVEFEDLEDHRQLLEPVPANLEGRHQAALRQQGRPDDPRRHRRRARRQTGDKRFHDYFKFEHEGKRGDLHPAPARHLHHHGGLQVDDIMAGKYGPPGGALLLFRTYPRIPFYEQVHDN
jgi:nitrate reductase alpha subunit